MLLSTEAEDMKASVMKASSSQRNNGWCAKCRFLKSCQFKYSPSSEVLDLSPLITNPDGSCQLYRDKQNKTSTFSQSPFH